MTAPASVQVPVPVSTPVLRGQCPSCGDEVLWVHTAATGKSMPIDPAPVESGGYLRLTGGRVAFTEPGEGLHVPHNETCKQGGFR